MLSDGDDEAWEPLGRPDYFWLSIASIHQVRAGKGEERDDLGNRSAVRVLY